MLCFLERSILSNKPEVKISPLTPERGMMARTLVEVGEKKYEVFTYDTRKSMDPVTFEFWSAVLADFPFETCVYSCVPANTPYTSIEQKLAELVPINSEVRRNIELGDLYVSRSTTEDAAALEHDNVIQEFKDDTIILMTQEERAAVFGPGKLFQ